MRWAKLLTCARRRLIFHIKYCSAIPNDIPEVVTCLSYVRYSSLIIRRPINPPVTVSLAATRSPADLIVITERIREGTS